MTQLRDEVEGVNRLVSGKEKGENAPASQEHIQPIWHGMPLVMSLDTMVSRYKRKIKETRLL